MKKRKQMGGEEGTLPRPHHTHTPCTRSLYQGCTRYDNEGMHKVWQVCYHPTEIPRRKKRYENPQTRHTCAPPTPYGPYL